MEERGHFQTSLHPSEFVRHGEKADLDDFVDPEPRTHFESPAHKFAVKTMERVLNEVEDEVFGHTSKWRKREILDLEGHKSLGIIEGIGIPPEEMEDVAAWKVLRACTSSSFPLVGLWVPSKESIRVVDLGLMRVLVECPCGAREKSPLPFFSAVETGASHAIRTVCLGNDDLLEVRDDGRVVAKMKWGQQEDDVIPLLEDVVTFTSGGNDLICVDQKRSCIDIFSITQVTALQASKIESSQTGSLSPDMNEQSVSPSSEPMVFEKPDHTIPLSILLDVEKQPPESLKKSSDGKEETPASQSTIEWGKLLIRTGTESSISIVGVGVIGQHSVATFLVVPSEEHRILKRVFGLPSGMSSMEIHAASLVCGMMNGLTLSLDIVSSQPDVVGKTKLSVPVTKVACLLNRWIVSSSNGDARMMVIDKGNTDEAERKGSQIRIGCAVQDLFSIDMFSAFAVVGVDGVLRIIDSESMHILADMHFGAWEDVLPQENVLKWEHRIEADGLFVYYGQMADGEIRAYRISLTEIFLQLFPKIGTVLGASHANDASAISLVICKTPLENRNVEDRIFNPFVLQSLHRTSSKQRVRTPGRTGSGTLRQARLGSGSSMRDRTSQKGMTTGKEKSVRSEKQRHSSMPMRSIGRKGRVEMMLERQTAQRRERDVRMKKWIIEEKTIAAVED
eukprot:TRINITY_DN81637_c0_g1_i1.p1 TRINITY_DN81637_c0_g1~~TRINITY_DN81637_c0_g1_i1.p1  ORF type:complete len:701 (+),score=201.93 TRINITY_DN81637_c0_g1_i1:74-2104(+)